MPLSTTPNPTRATAASQPARPERASRRALVVTGADAAKVRRLPMATELVDGQPAERVVDPALIERARSEGFQQGYTDGHAAGLESAERAAAAGEAARFARVQRAVDALAAAATSLDEREALAVEGLEDLLVAAAFHLAESLVGRELEVAGGGAAQAAVARALALAPPRGGVVVRLHPGDAAAVGAAGSALLDQLAPGRAVTLVADPGLDPGDAVAEVGATTVDGRLGAALERAARAIGLLGPEGDGSDPEGAA